MESMPTGWVRVAQLSVRRRLALSGWTVGPVIYFVVFVIPVNFVFGAAFGRGGVAGVILALLALVLVGAFVVVAHAVRHPAPCINLQTNELRVGQRTVPFAELDTAVLLATGLRAAPNLVLRVGSGKTMLMSVYLRNRHALLLDDRDREVLAEVLRRTSIAMPVSRDDPKGRFARYNFPGHLDRDTAIEMVTDTPRLGDQLPISL